MKASEAVKLVLLRRYSPWSRRPVCVPNTTPSIRGGSLDQRRCCAPVARSSSTRVWTDKMQGGQRDRDEEERRRRQQGGGAPGPSAGDYLAAGAAAATALAVGYGAYKIFGALSGGPAEQNHNQPHTSRTERPQQQMAKKTNYWLPEWLSPNILKSFWNKVEEQEDEERSAIREAVIVPEAFRHPYNQFDPWFHNLNNVLRIDNGERKELFKAFEEIIKVLLEGMGETDPLFKYLFRNIAPAGSSWENLRICSPNEFDVNLILFEPNIQQDVKVEVVGSGHVAIRLDCGFDVSDKKVLKKFNNLDHIISIKAQLRNWIEGSYVTRSKVMNWLNGVVDRALFDLQHHQWASVNQIYRSISGPAVTINAIMKNGKEFSIDLVPAFELSQEHLPAVTSAKLRAKRISPSRTWYAIPKGPSEASPQKMWRTSLYQAERDLINGQNHLKPCIRIMKRLRDEQKWKVVSSYYLKTKFMWMMDEQEHWKMGLGKIMMFALKSLEDALAKGQINYYWDDKLNLLENRGNEYFFYNVRNCLRNIMKDFERSVHDDTVNPMRHFGCDKDGNLLRPTLLPTFAGMSPSSSLNNEAECAVM